MDYNLTWIGEEIDPMLRSALPSKMTLFFREPYVRTEMRSMGGMATIVALVNTESGESHVLVTVVGVKSHYEEAISRNQLSLLFSGSLVADFPEYTERDTVFLGYDCLATQATLGKETGGRFELLFAPRIGWKSMNQHSPFQGIAGAVLKGSMELAGMTFLVEATSIKAADMPDSLFSIPAGYRRVNRTALMQLLGFDLLK